jgi:hypothetical protein
MEEQTQSALNCEASSSFGKDEEGLRGRTELETISVGLSVWRGRMGKVVLLIVERRLREGGEDLLKEDDNGAGQR